jgi:hypothetical protein
MDDDRRLGENEFEFAHDWMRHQLDQPLEPRSTSFEVVEMLMAIYYETRHQSGLIAKQSAEMAAHTKALNTHSAAMLRHCDSLDHFNRKPSAGEWM